MTDQPLKEAPKTATMHYIDTVLNRATQIWQR